MKSFEGISHFISEENEALIIKALRHFASGPVSGAEWSDATDLADALENDTYLLQTTTPPEIGLRGVDWPRIQHEGTA